MKFLLMSLLGLSTSVFAEALNYNFGSWGSGGGNAIVCFEDIQGGLPEKFDDKTKSHEIPDDLLDNITSIEIFDLYEAKLNRGFSEKHPEIIEIGGDESYEDYIKKIVNRFDKYVYTISSLIRDSRELIPFENFQFHQFSVRQQNDIDQMINMKNNCIFSTVAAQVNYDNFYEVHIDQRLFDHPKHSRQSRATLILHEMIYGYSRKKHQHDTSSRTRKLVGLLVGKHETYTVNKIAKAMVDLGYYNHHPESDFSLFINRFNRVYNQTVFYSDTNFFLVDAYNLDWNLVNIYDEFDKKFSSSSLFRDLEKYYPNIGENRRQLVSILDHHNQYVRRSILNDVNAVQFLTRLNSYLADRASKIEDFLSKSFSTNLDYHQDKIKSLLTKKEFRLFRTRFSKVYPAELADLSQDNSKLQYYVFRYLSDTQNDIEASNNFTFGEIIKKPKLLMILVWYLHNSDLAYSDIDDNGGHSTVQLPMIRLDKVID